MARTGATTLRGRSHNGLADLLVPPGAPLGALRPRLQEVLAVRHADRRGSTALRRLETPLLVGMLAVAVILVLLLVLEDRLTEHWVVKAVCELTGGKVVLWDTIWECGW